MALVVLSDGEGIVAVGKDIVIPRRLRCADGAAPKRVFARM